MNSLRLAVLGGLIAIIAGAGWSSAPEVSLRPEARPGAEVAAVRRPVARPADEAAVETEVEPEVEPKTDVEVEVARAQTPDFGGLEISIRPRPRPIVAQKPARVVFATAGAAVLVSPRPDERPRNLRTRVVRASVVQTPSQTPARTRRGSVCGDRSIRGETISPIAGRMAGCGVAAPVRVTEISGIKLTQASTLHCDTALALKRWIDGSVVPTIGRLGGGVASLKVAAHYSCRTINNQRGGRVSEHGKGRAIDISAINLRNGVSITVLRGWHDPAHGQILRRLQNDACGPFKTTLGPNSDRYHQDHFHFDVAQRRNGGVYCK